LGERGNDKGCIWKSAVFLATVLVVGVLQASAAARELVVVRTLTLSGTSQISPVGKRRIIHFVIGSNYDLQDLREIAEQVASPFRRSATFRAP